MRAPRFGKRAARARIAVLLTGMAMMAACTANGSSTPASSAATSSAVTPASDSAAPTSASLIDDSQLTADLAGVTQRKVAKVAPTRLAAGLVAPTNRWFSGLVFG